jgi:hypothetical protein
MVATGPTPDIVSTGILTQAEYDQLKLADQADVDRQTQLLRARHGPEWLVRERERLRKELTLLYGVPAGGV